LKYHWYWDIRILRRSSLTYVPGQSRRRRKNYQRFQTKPRLTQTTNCETSSRRGSWNTSTTSN